MSEKRFTWKTEKLQHLDEEVLIVVDNENKEWKGHILNVVDLLNQLHQENKFLEEDIDDYYNALFDLHKKYDKLEKENEQLQKQINDKNDVRKPLHTQIPTTTIITSKRRVVPLNMRHRWY